MKKNKFILVGFLASFSVLTAVAADTIFQTDKLKFGKANTAGDKELILDINQGASNPKVKSTVAGQDIQIVTDAVKIGKAVAGDKTITIDNNAGSANPKIKWDNATSKLKFSNDGTTFKSFGSGGGASGINLAQEANIDFEAGTGNWAASGGSFTVATSGSNLLIGGGSGVFNASAGSQTLTNDTITVTTSTVARLGGVDGYAACQFKTTATDYKLQVFDGTNVLSEATISASTAISETGAYFPIPTSGTIALRIISATDAADLAVDNCYVGSSPIPQVKSDGLVGVIKVSGCAADWITSSATFANFAAQAGCTYTTEGLALQPSTNIPAIKFASLPAGEYSIIVSGSLYGGTASTLSAWQFHDGTSASRDAVQGTSDATVYPTAGGVGAFSIKYSTTQSNVTLQLQGKVSGGGSIYIGQTTMPMTIKVYRTNSIAETGFTFDTTASSWSGYHTTGGATLWTRTNAVYGAMTPTGTAAIVERSNTNFGTVTTAGSNLPGITFTPKGAYKYEVCAHPKVRVSSTNDYGAFKLWDGTTTIAEGEIRNTANLEDTIPLCGHYQASGVSPVTLEIQCKAATAACELYSTTAASSIEWSIKAINQAFPAPVVAPETRSEVWMDTYASASPYGSTNTEVFRYSNTYKNVGTAFTAASSTTLGHSITLNEGGLYCANGNYRDGGSTASFLITINSTSAASGGQCVSTGQTGAARNDNSCSACFIGAQGDVVRALGSGTTDQSSSAGSMVGFLRIVKMSR